MIILFFTLFLGCSGANNDVKTEWNNTVFPDLKRVEEITTNDTTYLTFYDNSWIWDTDYVEYRMKYVIWKNRDRIDRTYPIKTTITHLDGEGVTLSAVYGTKDIDTVFNVFGNYPKFQKVSESFLSEFNPTEFTTLRDANLAINDHKNESLTFAELLFDLSRNAEDSLAYKRAKMIIEMVHIVGMKDFFDEHEISGEQFSKKMNTLLMLTDWPKVVLAE